MSSTHSASASASAKGLVDSAANPAFKIVGICLAVGSGLFIGSSFVIKKKGLLRATAKYGNQAGEGHAYLKSWLWWTGMISMIIGEILNFVAYAFTEAILVTPFGALSVVICAILSHFLLSEKLSFFGWIGCGLCIIGAIILALNAPETQSVTTIAGFKKLFLSPGFLVWGSILIIASICIVVFVAPKWGKKNMFSYIGVCSLIGGISVSCTQGLGATIVTSIQGNNQVKNWFFWFLAVFVVITLLVEINYLNKALELFSAAMVVPFYFTAFTSCTLITSFILYQGLHASAVSLITMVLGFIVIVAGITLLQMSKVDPKQLTKLDRRSTMLFEAAQHGTEGQEKGEVSALEDPGMDALRGGFGAVGSIIRARSVSRRISNASTIGQNGRFAYGQPDLSTTGLGGVQRFQLSDNPMPSDAMDRVSLHSAKSPPPLFHSQSFSSIGPGAINERAAKSHLKFEEEDVVHQYGYGRNDEATHYSRHHPANPYQPAPGQSIMPGRTTSHRSFSGHGLYPPVPEVDEDASAEDHASTAEEVNSAALEKGARYYPDPYRNGPEQTTPRPGQGAQRMEPAFSAKSHDSAAARIGQLFHFSQSSDPSRPRSTTGEKDDVRGGAHRGVKDYPHLKRGESGRGQQEKDERAKLVAAESSDDEGGSRRSSISSRNSYRDEEEAHELVQRDGNRSRNMQSERTYAQPSQAQPMDDNEETPKVRSVKAAGRADVARYPSPLPRAESVPMGHERQRTTSSSGGSVGLGIGSGGGPRVQGPRGPRGPSQK